MQKTVKGILTFNCVIGMYLVDHQTMPAYRWKEQSIDDPNPKSKSKL